MSTKQQIVEDAYGEIGLASYVFDIDPEELEAGKRKLDAQQAEWDAAGLRLGYNFPGELNDESGLPDKASSAVVADLAIRIAPSKGKSVSADTQRAAARGYLRLVSDAAKPQAMQQNTYVPRGSGAKTWRNPLGTFQPPTSSDQLPTEPGGDLTDL